MCDADHHQQLIMDNLGEIMRIYESTGQNINIRITTLYNIVKHIDVHVLPSINCAFFWAIEEAAVDAKYSVIKDVYRFPNTPATKDYMITLACNILTNFIQFKASMRKYIETKAE